VPLPVVVALLLHDVVRRRALGALPLLFLILPTMWIAASAASVAGHYLKTHDPTLTVVERTNLRGLIVPTEQDDILAAFAKGTNSDQLLSRARVTRPRHELSAYEYVETVLEAASLLSNPRYHPGVVVLLDQVNPLPFMLGWPPPRGGNLWSGSGMPLQPAGQVFSGADYVLIPNSPPLAPGRTRQSPDSIVPILPITFTIWRRAGAGGCWAARPPRETAATRRTDPTVPSCRHPVGPRSARWADPGDARSFVAGPAETRRSAGLAWDPAGG